MPLLDLNKITVGVSRGWSGYLRDWDRTLRSGNYPETTRYNFGGRGLAPPVTYPRRPGTTHAADDKSATAAPPPGRRRAGPGAPGRARRGGGRGGVRGVVARR